MLTTLQAAYDSAVARANRVASREPNLITTFALGAEIETLKTRAAQAFDSRDFSGHAAHHATIRTLQRLIDHASQR
jgi:hypothetical protein